MKFALLGLHFVSCTLLVSSLCGQSLLLNFGAVVDNNSNSPAHVNGGLVGNSWNTITGDSASIVNANGESTGITINLGKETGGSTEMLNWDSTGFSSLVGNAASGVFSGTNAQSALFVNDGATSGIDLGVRVSGLAPGEYQIFGTANNTNTTNTNQYEFYFLKVGSGSGNTDYSVAPGLIVTNGGTGNWVNGVTYRSATLTLEAGEDLVVITKGLSSNQRGFLNTLEYVAIPEFSTFALSLGVIGFAAVWGRRRHLRVNSQ